MDNMSSASITRVRLRDFSVLADVGINPDEVGKRQPLIISVEVTVEAGEALTRIDRTVDYRRIVEAVEALAVTHVPLIEAFGEQLSRTFLGWPNVAAVRVVIDKPFALARGMAGVEILATRRADRGSSPPNLIDAGDERCVHRACDTNLVEQES